MALRDASRQAHEAPIHLELAEGNVAQLGERRVTGAEVVNGQADALEAQAREDVQRRQRVLHQPALRHFQHQAREGSGNTRPSWGCRQRTRVSTPATVPVASATLGW